ncbi:MAG TPA: response regulator [Planktothrix sp.]|jgi:polar amino acid transport system substrate-binding protein
MWRVLGSIFGNRAPVTEQHSGDGELHDGHLDQASKSLKVVAVRDNVFANISAELRTPLTMILSPLESLLSGEHGSLSDRQRRILKMVQNNSVKLLQMISGLLDFSKLEAGKMEVRRQAVDVQALTSTIAADFHALAGAKNIKLTCKCDNTPMLVLIDRYLFERILFNLLSNAVKFTPPGGSVTVSLNSCAGHLKLTVADTGIGIASGQQDNIFREFHNLDESSPRTTGIKLGLSLVKQFATLLGGTVTVESELGKGSKFIVDMIAPATTLKLATKSSATDSGARLMRQFETTLSPCAPQMADREAMGKPRVLIAEPNVELAAYVADLLRDTCQTRISTDGEEALEQLNSWHPDMVLAAVMMPKMDGLELCREAKARAETACMPVVLITAFTQRDEMIKGWEAGADDYLFKPFHPSDLVARVRSLLRNVQQRRRAQEQIERLNEALERRVIELASTNKELHSTTQKLEQARDQALEASRFKSVFLANMSHEVRTPINGVISMSDVLMRTPLNLEQTEIASIIRDSAGALLDIVNDILDFSKIEAGKLELEIVDFDLFSVVEGTAELVADQARSKGLSLMTYVAPEIPSLLRGDPGRLRQILLNLLSNAIKFTQSGEVLVQATLDAKDDQRCRIRFSITDTGIGMAHDTVHRLFQPFTQADGSITRRYGGTGLGLSIAKLLVELLGGHIGVRSTEGKGSTFWFSIPIERTRLEPTPSQAVSPDLQGARVLVVDALSGTARILCDYIKSWELTLDRVDSGREALAKMHRASALNQPFDAVIVELDTPDLDGFELAKAVRQDEALANTPLILCTASADESLGQRALQAGFSAYLNKPIKQSRLFDCLMLVMDHHGVQDARHMDHAPQPSSLTATGLTACQYDRGMILVAEDNPVNQKVATLLLKELGFTAHVVANGAEALDAVTRAHYALILMDCQMPEMDGFEATSAVRRLETVTGRHMPIIAMTAHAMQGDREKCIAAGMDDYISKPVTAGKLQEVLARWVKADPGSAGRTTGEITLPLETVKGGIMTQTPDGGQPQSPARSAEQPPINIQALENACGEDGARELIEIFLDSTVNLLQRMDDALASKNGKMTKAHAHEMKGACASVGATEMSATSRQLEQAGLGEDWTQAATLIAELKSEFERVRNFCQGLPAPR